MAIIPETRYPGKIEPASPEYPLGKARNITTPSDGTGTPWDEAIPNDTFGFHQALLAAANITASGDPDEVGASQYFEALQELFARKFGSVADMQADTTLKVGQRVRTYAFRTALVQDWEVAGSQPVGEFSVALAGGLFAVEISNVKYFESFGAYANGATLDDDAFEFARSYAGTVLGRGDYQITEQHDLTNGATWYGNGSKISMQGNNTFGFVNSDCYIGGFELDGLDEDHTAYVIRIASPSQNARIGHMIYRNFHGITSTQTYPLSIPLYGAENFEVGPQEFYNITQDDDGAVTGKGFVGGVYLVGLDAEVPNGKSYGKVGDVYGNVVKSVDAGSGVVQDSDLVRVFAETASLEEFDITFGNISGRNVYKRLVKASSCGGLTFGDVKSFNPGDPTEVYSLHAAVEVLSTGFNMKFGNVEAEGTSDRVVWFKGSGNQAGDVFDGAGSQAVIFGGDGDEAVSCQVGNVLGRGADNNAQQGNAVLFFNADQCQAGDITGLFARAVDTNVQNMGKNTVNSIACPAQVNTINGDTTINAINADITVTPVAGSHYAFGKGARVGTAEVITDGRVTVSIVGAGVDVDLGNFRLVRATAANGVEANHSVFTTASATDGILRGKLEVEVNATVAGSPSGSAGKTLAYVTGLNVKDFSLDMNVTASVRGATGFHYWFNGVDGSADKVAVKSAITLVGSQLDGKLGISKLEYLVPGGATVTCADEVNIGFAEKEATVVISGANYSPNVVNSTR